MPQGDAARPRMSSLALRLFCSDRVSSRLWSGPSVGSGVVVVEVLVDQAHVGLARIARSHELRQTRSVK